MKIKIITAILLLMVTLHCSGATQPNILFCISDDQSYAHTGANGDPVVATPAFDRIAREGIRFTHAFCDAPTCGPSRSAILTGQHIWRLEEAGNIHSTLSKKFATYTDELQKSGYAIGFTGKGWGPGDLKPGGRSQNPAGIEFGKFQYGKGSLEHLPRPQQGMSNDAYAKNFEAFLKQCPDGKPFCFWLGTREPHRGYKKGAGKASGKDPQKVIIPSYFPDHPIVRSDILDYYMEVEHFDREVAMAIALLEASGQLDNTIIVVTSDHGMPFPRGKATLYDAGSRVPLAIRWPTGIKSSGRVNDSFVNLSDLAPTFLEAAGLKVPSMMTATSLTDIFSSPKAKGKENAYIAMERHDGCRKGGKGYPSRALRTKEFLYILNYKPDRWPAGDPDRKNCARDLPYGEYDSSPTKSLLLDNEGKKGFQKFHDLSFAKHPGQELYDMTNDPDQIVNLAKHKKYADTLKQLSNQLNQHLKETKDPRALGLDAPWDYYPYYGRLINKDWRVDARPKDKAPH